MHRFIKHIIPCVLILFSGCILKKKDLPEKATTPVLPGKFLVVLGIAQDAGYPQIGCVKECCLAYWKGQESRKQVTCLALVDRNTGRYWLIEATPDLPVQLHSLQNYLPVANDYSPDGIFITHAHTGHYTGLMQLGREAMGARQIPVWVMPRMDSFMRNNGPWSQLVNLENISLQQLISDSTCSPDTGFSITPIRVPHRDEYSETVGFRIRTSGKNVLFIPDIDKWEKWERDITGEIASCDIAFLDGTFFQDGELPGRDMREVPHPFVQESMKRFASLSPAERAKIVFIHFNHTNPLVRKSSPEKQAVLKAGFGVAEEGMIIGL